jgi:hypothetical protein
VQPEVSHDGAQPLGIDVRVARRLDTLMPRSACTSRRLLVEKERRGCMPQGMSENDRHPRSLAGQLEACVERPVAKKEQGPGQNRLTEIPGSSLDQSATARSLRSP